MAMVGPLWVGRTGKQVTIQVTTTQSTPDQARRPQMPHPACPALTGPSATPSDETGLDGMQKAGARIPLAPPDLFSQLRGLELRT
jgi:hypothetical protein